MTISQEFSQALVADRAEQESYKPLIEKFEELKEVLQSNFKMKRKHRKWYGSVTWEVLPAIEVELENKFTHNSSKYLFIRINGHGYVMGLGEIGELKDRLYFNRGTMVTGKKQVIYAKSHMFGESEYSLEDKITNVQLFSNLIKEYRTYLLVKG
jgi:hypothetical protein